MDVQGSMHPGGDAHDAKPRLKRKLKRVPKSVLLNSSIVASRKIIKKAHNQSINTPMRMQTLQTNNRALARSLEGERNEVKILQERYLGAITTIQELETRLNSLSNVKNAHQQGLGRIRGILLQVTQDLVGTVTLLEEAINECSQPGRKSSIAVGLSSARSSTASTGRESTEVMPSRTIYGAYKPQNKELVDDQAAAALNTQATLQGASRKVRRAEEDARALMELSVVEEQSFFVDDVPIMFADEKNPNRRQPQTSMQTVCEDEEGSPSTRRASRVPRRVAVYNSGTEPQLTVRLEESENAEKMVAEKVTQPTGVTEACSNVTEKSKQEEAEVEDKQKSKKNTDKSTSTSVRSKSKSKSPDQVGQDSDEANHKFEDDPDFVNSHKRISRKSKSKRASSKQQDTLNGLRDVNLVSSSNAETISEPVSDKEVSSEPHLTSHNVHEDVEAIEKGHKMKASKKDVAKPKTSKNKKKQEDAKHVETDEECILTKDNDQRGSRSRSRRTREPITYKDPDSDDDFPSQTSVKHSSKEQKKVDSSTTSNKIEASNNLKPDRRQTRQRSRSRSRRGNSTEPNDEHRKLPIDMIEKEMSTKKVTANVEESDKENKDEKSESSKEMEAEPQISKENLTTEQPTRSRSRSRVRLSKVAKDVAVEDIAEAYDRTDEKSKKTEVGKDTQKKKQDQDKEEAEPEGDDAFVENSEELRRKEEEMAFKPRHKLLHSDDETRGPPDLHVEHVDQTVTDSTEDEGSQNNEEKKKEKLDKKRTSSIGIGRKRRKTRNRINYSDDEEEEEEKDVNNEKEQLMCKSPEGDSRGKEQVNELHGGLFVSLATPKALHPVKHSDEDWIKTGKPTRPLATFIAVSPMKKPKLSKGNGDSSKVNRKSISKPAPEASNKKQDRTSGEKEKNASERDIEKETRRRTIEIAISPVEGSPVKVGDDVGKESREQESEASEAELTKINTAKEKASDYDIPLKKDKNQPPYKEKKHQRRGTFAVSPTDKKPTDESNQGMEDVSGSKDSKLKLRRGTFLAKARKDSECSNDGSASESNEGKDNEHDENVPVSSDSEASTSHRSRRETFLKPLLPKAAKLHKRKGTFTKEEDIVNLDDESPSILLASEDELEFDLDPDLANEVMELESPVKDNNPLPQPETTICGNDSMELTEVVPSNIDKVGSTASLTTDGSDAATVANLRKSEDAKRKIESGMAVLQKRLSKIAQARDGQEEDAESDVDVDATENFDKILMNVRKTTKVSSKSDHKPAQEKLSTVREDSTHMVKAKQDDATKVKNSNKPSKNMKKQAKTSAESHTKNAGTASKIPTRDQGSDSDRGSTSSLEGQNEDEGTRVKVLQKPGKHGKITFTAGRKHTQSNGEVSSGLKKVNTKTSLPLISKVKDTLKSKTKQKSASKASQDKGTSSSAAPPVKTIFDISMNESVEVSSSYNTFKERVSAVAIGDLVKDTVPITMPPPIPREHDETVITDSPHGIMVALGNGVRTKPRARTKSKQVSYAEDLAETHLTTPAPSSKPGPDHSNRKECGHTPPKVPKVNEPTSKRRSVSGIPSLASQKTTTPEVHRNKEVVQAADISKGTEKQIKNTSSDTKEETRVKSVKSKEGKTTKDIVSKNNDEETVAEQTQKHERASLLRAAPSEAEKRLESSNETVEKTPAESSSKDVGDEPLTEAPQKESTKSKGKTKSSKAGTKAAKSVKEKKSSKTSKEHASEHSEPTRKESLATTAQPEDEDEDFAPRRKRRAAASAVSYKEPSCTSKLRRGDKGSSTIYEGAEKDKHEKQVVNKRPKSTGTAKQRRSSKTHQSALSTITNIHHEVRVKQEPIDPDMDT